MSYLRKVAFTKYATETQDIFSYLEDGGRQGRRRIRIKSKLNGDEKKDPDYVREEGVPEEIWQHVPVPGIELVVQSACEDYYRKVSIEMRSNLTGRDKSSPIPTKFETKIVTIM